jgi:hypothetical protein
VGSDERTSTRAIGIAGSVWLPATPTIRSLTAGLSTAGPPHEYRVRVVVSATVMELSVAALDDDQERKSTVLPLDESGADASVLRIHRSSEVKQAMVLRAGFSLDAEQRRGRTRFWKRSGRPGFACSSEVIGFDAPGDGISDGRTWP